MPSAEEARLAVPLAALSAASTRSSASQRPSGTGACLLPVVACHDLTLERLAQMPSRGFARRRYRRIGVGVAAAGRRLPHGGEEEPVSASREARVSRLPERRRPE